jgi:hypothetical protein
LVNAMQHECPIVEPHQCPPPNRLNIQRHWIEVHDPNHKIVNYLDSKMLDKCDRECQPDYIRIMEARNDNPR